MLPDCLFILVVLVCCVENWLKVCVDVLGVCVCVLTVYVLLGLEVYVNISVGTTLSRNTHRKRKYIEFKKGLVYNAAK